MPSALAQPLMGFLLLPYLIAQSIAARVAVPGTLVSGEKCGQRLAEHSTIANTHQLRIGFQAR